MTLIFSSSTLNATDPGFQSALEAAIAPLKSDPRVTGLTTPYGVPASEQATFISRDGHKALVIVEFKDPSHKSEQYVNEVVAAVHPGLLTVVATGQVPLNLAFNSTLDSDLQRAEYVALPVTFLMLILIFAAVVAALLPLGVGLLAIVGGLAGTMFLAHFTDVSQYATNIVTLIGLAVAIDYSLFVVNRFRDELASGATREDAIAIAMSTAGRAITFSGVAVAIGLSAMLFFQGTFMASMGAAGAIVVAIAVLYGLTFLPAALAILGPHVDRFRVPYLGRRLAQLPTVLRVQSIVNVDPGYPKADYERLFGQPVAELPPTLQQALSLTTGQHLTMLYVVTNKQYTSDEARSLVRAVRGE